MSGIIAHPPGVYFNLPEAEYHADWALGSSDVRLLQKSAADYWWQSAMNPLREPEEDTPALLYGRALHKLVLEGREAFEEVFCVEPDKRDYPDALVTVAHLEAYLAEKGVKKPAKAKKEDLEQLARPHGAVLWSDIMREATMDAQARTLLKPKMFGQVVMAGEQIRKNHKLTEAFQNGCSEVSVFWEEDGIRRKARIDYLKVRPIVNLKSFRPRDGEAPYQAVARAIAAHRYDMQAAHELKAREMAGWFIRERPMAINGATDRIATAWMNAVGAETQFECWLVFFQAEGAPNVLLRCFRPGSPVITNAETDIQFALTTYRDHTELYGASMWPYADPLPDPDVDFDMLPRWFAPEMTT